MWPVFLIVDILEQRDQWRHLIDGSVITERHADRFEQFVIADM